MSDFSEIVKMNAELAEAIAQKDAKKTAEVYAEDSTLMVFGMPMLVGRQAILEGYAGYFSDDDFELKFESISMKGSGANDVVIDIGKTFFITAAGSDVQEGKYLVVWRRQEDGSWKIESDAVSQNQ